MKEKAIQTLVIVTEPKDVDGSFGKKLECQVGYVGITDDSPDLWTLNKKSRNTLIDKLGNDTTKWIGRKIPIETAITEKGRAIYVDAEALSKQMTQEVIA